MKINRINNTKRNILSGTINMSFSLLLPFLTRTILLKILGEQFLGLNSLFTSVLQILNIGELGLSSAITFGLYKPIAEGDTETICAYMKLYRNSYRILGLIILLIGLLLLPFIEIFINGDIPANVNIYVLYLIFLLNSILSYYFFAYKGTLLLAHHRSDLLSNIATILNFIKNLAQILVVLLFQNFYLYVIVLPIITIMNNLLTSFVVNKMYPEYYCYGNLSNDKKNMIYLRLKGLVVAKVASVVRDSTDTLIISAALSLSSVAIYGNYFYILSAVHGVLTIITSAMKAGVGNSLVTESREKNIEDMIKFTFYYSFLISCFASCLFVLYQPFMNIWAGTSLTTEFSTMILFVVYFYLISSMDIRNVYIEAAGLWYEFRNRAIFEAMLNLFLSLILVKKYGINGVLFSTIISFVAVNVFYGSFVFITKLFIEIGYGNYIKMFLKNTINTISVIVCTSVFCLWLPQNTILLLLIKGMFCFVCSAMLYLLFSGKNSYVKSGFQLIKYMWRKS